MSPFKWTLLLVVFIFYLVLGGTVFMYFEQNREVETQEDLRNLRRDIKEVLFLMDRELLMNRNADTSVIEALTTAKLAVIDRLSQTCGVGELLSQLDRTEIGYFGDSALPMNTSHTEETEEDIKEKWSFYNSVFFAFTVITTIGYGHLAPATTFSKYFVMVYALIGIPLNSILLSGLGEYFSSRIIKAHKRNKDRSDSRLTFILEILFYLIPGFVVFLLIPAGIFVAIENWSYLDALYYAFISLTTIGFGDFVAGVSTRHTFWMWVYKISIIIWITFGLGYLIMILGFISKGLTHKKVRAAIEKRLNAIRFTRERLADDIDYVRNVVDELYRLKLNTGVEEGVLVDGNLGRFDKRAASLPGIYLPNKNSPRARGLSTTIVPDLLDGEKSLDLKTPELPRRYSDTDLDKIDVDMKFENALRNQITVDEIMENVANVLSGDVMQDVLETVEELNEYEAEILSGDPKKLKDKPHGKKSTVQQPTLSVSEYQDKPHGRKSTVQQPRLGVNEYQDKPHGRKSTVQQPRFSIGEYQTDIQPGWDLSAFSESDEEVLIGDLAGGQNDTLNQVIVHGGQLRETSTLSPSSPSRKISASSRSPSDGPSRKTSRNESFGRRKISRNEAMPEKKSAVGVGGNRSPYLNPLAQRSRKVSGTEPVRKISQESRMSNISGTSTKGAASRKNSLGQISDGQASRVSVDSSPLAELLQSLDAVHSRLYSKKPSATGDSSHDESSRRNSRFSSRPSRIHRNRDSSDNSSAAPQTRRRKHGIIYPNFAYLNAGFLDDTTGESRRRKISAVKFPDEGASMPTTQR